MKARRVLLHLLVFLAIGEALIRFDQHTAFFRTGEQLANQPKNTDLLISLENGIFRPAPDEMRVMIVGDSFLFGAGVPATDVFSNRLQEELNADRSRGASRASVLDVTRPGNNTYGNKLDFLKYSSLFHPDIVIWAYNANDVYGDQGVESGSATQISSKSASSGDRDLDLVVSVRRIVYNSRLFAFVLQSLAMEMKLAGVSVPGSEFDHQLNNSHVAGFPGWTKSQLHLKEAVLYAEQHHQRMIVVNVPELNMLANYHSFGPLNRTISVVFTNLGVGYVELADTFLQHPSAQYAISRYDGHPNAAAHRLIAPLIADRILHPNSGISRTTGACHTRQSEGTAGPC